MQRSTYQARLADPEIKVPPREVFAEVCADIRIAVRRCLNVFKPIRFMYIEAQRTAQRRQDILEKVHARLPRVRLKVIFIGMKLKAYRSVRRARADDPAEQLWQHLFDSLASACTD